MGEKKIILCLLSILFVTLTARAQVERAYFEPIFQKGMCYATWDADDFASRSSDKSILAMSEAGIKSIAVVVTWYQNNFNSTNIKRTENSPTDLSLCHAIDMAHKAGMSVMLKPHIDLLDDDGFWRGDIDFAQEEEWKAWFTSYSNFINHYAKLAEGSGVEFFCIGTELSYAATKTHFWKTVVIPHVREVFSGQLIYAANWDTYQEVGFWDDLDYVGIDGYFPLSENDNPSLDNLKEGWKVWLDEIEIWQKKINKPVIFTEIGYSSSDKAAEKPWETHREGKPNTTLQELCYKAFFETFWHKEWFFGVYWWMWDTYPEAGGKYNRHFTPQNKPALEELKRWYNSETN